MDWSYINSSPLIARIMNFLFYRVLQLPSSVISSLSIEFQVFLMIFSIFVFCFILYFFVRVVLLCLSL